jgi:hypothetical protein
MFEHFFDANSPFMGLVNWHWPMPLLRGPRAARIGAALVYLAYFRKKKVKQAPSPKENRMVTSVVFC